MTPAIQVQGLTKHYGGRAVVDHVTIALAPGFLDFIARLFGLSQRREAVDEALGCLGLSANQHLLAGTLSGGCAIF